MPQLLFYRGRTPVFQVRLQSSSIKIGRAEICDLILAEPEVSREHAAVYIVEGQYFIKKIGNAILHINGCDSDRHLLSDRDVIKIGPWEAVFLKNSCAPGLAKETQVTRSGSGHTRSVSINSRGFLVNELEIRVDQPSREPWFYSFSQERLTVGSDEGNELVLGDLYISSRHLKLVLEEGKVWIYDLNSTNGTYLNGVRIREAEWETGGVLKLGNCRLTLLESRKVKLVQPGKGIEFCGLSGGSQAMHELYGILERIGPTEATVLILGESGTGKELVSRAVHQLSSRNQGPFVALNCGAISPELMESELFGHEKGAFTGAARRHEGAFGQARGGTLFLDEIGELPLELQPKLLRVLENKSFRLVGGSEEIQADVRVVAATHRDMADLVKNKKFREDLFFRLFVLPVAVPPLRDRLEDLDLLCRTFLREFSPEGREICLNSKAMQKLKEHSFPGNVRELRNVLLRSVVLSQGKEILPDHIVFPEKFSETQNSINFSGIEKLEDLERKLFLKALNTYGWNKAKAAESLGIAKSTLFAKIKLYALENYQK